LQTGEQVPVLVRNLGWQEVVVYIASPVEVRLGEVSPLGEETFFVSRHRVSGRKVQVILHPMGSPKEYLPKVYIPFGVTRVNIRLDPHERSSIYFGFR
jgi:hypothetical protein